MKRKENVGKKMPRNEYIHNKKKIHCVFIVFACGGSFFLKEGCVVCCVLCVGPRSVCRCVCPFHVAVVVVLVVVCCRWWTSMSLRYPGQPSLSADRPSVSPGPFFFSYITVKWIYIECQTRTLSFDVVLLLFGLVWFSQGVVVASADDVASSINKLFV